MENDRDNLSQDIYPEHQKELSKKSKNKFLKLLWLVAPLPISHLIAIIYPSVFEGFYFLLNVPPTLCLDGFKENALSAIEFIFFWSIVLLPSFIITLRLTKKFLARFLSMLSIFMIYFFTLGFIFMFGLGRHSYGTPFEGIGDSAMRFTFFRLVFSAMCGGN